MSLPPTVPANPTRRRGVRAVLILGALIVFLVASALGVFAYRYAQPRTYLAQAVIESVPGGGFDGDDMAMHAQALRGPELLDRVAGLLELRKVYAREGASVT